MKQEEKDLLIKDLCARIPYGVCVHTWYNKPLDIGCTGVDIYTNIIKLDLPKDDDATVYIDNVKPYLRPMSSMTEDERKELSSRYVWKIDIYGQIQIRYHSEGIWDNDTDCPTEEYLKLFDWLNTHYFDYRGLIEMGLALVAPEDMYK